MPISRYQIRNEYNLADPELYTAADRDDPEAILEGVAMAGLVGVLRQLGDLAEFAAEIFHDLHEEVMATSARGHGLMLRVQQLEEEFPSLGKAFLSQTSQLHFTSNAGTDWHANLQMDQNLVTRGDLPRFIMDSYEECRGPPRLFLLDKFDIAGAGACLKRYTDPSFFKTTFVSSLSVKADIQKEKKARKAKKKGPRWKNGETPEAFSASDFCSKLRQVASDEPSRVSGKIPIRGVLKRKNLNVSSFCSKNGRSYMEQFHEILSLQHGSVSENSFTHSSMKRRSSDSSEMFSEIHEIVPKDSVIKPMQKEHTLDILKSPIGELGPEIVKQGPVDCLLKPINEPSDGKDSTFLDYVPKNVGIDGDKSDDNISELENYVDALTTVESEIEMDSETRSKHVRGFFSLPNQVLHPNTKTDEQLDMHPHLSDSSSVRSSSASYDWNGLLQKGKSSRSNSDSIGNMEEAFPPSKICRVEPHDISSEKISKDEDTFKSKSPVRLLPSSASCEIFEVPDTVSQAEVSFASCITDSTSNIGQFSSNKPEQAEISSSYGEACTVESSPNIKAIDQMLFGVLPGTPIRSELPSETKDMKNISGFDLDFPAKLSPMEETSSNNNSIGEAAEDRNTDLPSKVEDDTVHLKVTGILSETPVISGPPMETEEQEPSTFDVGFSEKSVEDSLFEESLIGKTAEVYKSDQSSEAEVDTMHEKSTVGDMETNLSPESSLSWLPLSHNLMAEINEERIQRSVMKEPYALSDRSTSPQEYFPVSAPSELTVGFCGLGMAGESNLRGGDVKYLTTNSVEMSDALESDMKNLSMTEGTDLNFINMMENPSCPMDSSPGSAPVEVHEQSDVLEAKAVSLEANANDCASNLIVSPRRSVVEVDERFDDLVTRDTIEESGTESIGAKVIPSKASFIELHKMPDGLITSGTPDEACTVNESDEHGLNLNQVKDPEACEPNLIVSLDAQKESDDLVTGDALIETDTDDGVLNRVKVPETCGPNVSVSLQAPFTDLQKEVTGDAPTEADTSDCRFNMVQFQEDSGDHAELLECPTEIILDQHHLEINMEDRGSDTQTIPFRANEVDQPVLGSADLNSDLLNPDSDSEFIDSIHPSPVEDARIKRNPTDGSVVSCSEADQESELDFLPYEHSSSTVKDLSEQDVRNLQTEVESSVGFSHEEVESPKSPKKINKKSEHVSPPLSPRDCLSEVESSAMCFVPELARASEQVMHEHSPQASLEALHEEGVVPCLSKETNQISESKLLHETHCDSVGAGISLPTEFLLEPAIALDQVLEKGENPKSSYLQHETAQSLTQTDHEPSEPPVPLDSCFATNKDMSNGLYASSITMVVSEAFTSAPCHNFKNSEPGVSLSTSISPSFGLPILETDKQLSSNVEEMPPLPPLPPLQWRVGKLQHGSNTLGEEMSEPRNLCTPFSATEDEKTLQGFKFFGGQNFHPTNPFCPLPTFTSADLAGPPSNPFVSLTVEGDNQNVFLGLDGQMFYPSNPFACLEAEKPQNGSLTFGGETESLQSAFVPPIIEAEMKPQQSSMTTEEDVGPPTIPLEVPPSEEDKLDRPRRKDPLIEAVAAHDRSMLRKVSERIRPEIKPKVDERDSLLEQIRAKSFNLKPAVATRPIVHGPKTNLNVVAILEKAHAIRQALAGSDEDDDADSWSDS